MKRTISLILAVLFVIALFAGCGGNNTTTGGSTTGGSNTGSTNTGSSDTGSSDGGEDAPVVEDSPYNFAKGKYETDAEGWPLEKYVYELPLCTTDEILTQMTLSFSPQYLGDDGFEGIRTYAEAQEMTGVNIEYNLIASASYSTTLSVMEASDELCDITAGYYAYHSGSTLTECIDDEIIANIYDYKEYAPNYCRWAKDYEWIERQWSVVNNPTYDKWIGFVGFYDQPCQSTGYFIRQDWMDELGLGKADGFKTFDQWHDILVAFKTAGYCEFPLIMFSNLDGAANVWNDFGTTPYTGGAAYNRVVDGKVEFNGTSDLDKELMMYLNGWYNEGLIDPNFASYSDNNSLQEALTTNRVGTAYFNPSEVGGWEMSSADPDCTWEPNLKLRRSEDNIIHWNLDPDMFGGTGSSVSASCENIELAVTYIDWCYSDFGADWMNWGPEGYGWDYDENGNRIWNEMITGFELGVGWATMFYFYNPMDAGINMQTRNYAYPGGDRCLAFFDVWNRCLDYYDGAYNYPASIKLSDEESAEINSLRSDLNTFFAENYVGFFDGSKSFAEWDSFQEQLAGMGMTRMIEIYQEKYDAYIAA